MRAHIINESETAKIEMENGAHTNVLDAHVFTGN